MPTSSSGSPAPDPRALWLSRRARNVPRRPVFLGSVTLLAFVVALVTLVLIPRGVRRVVRRVPPIAEQRPDTLRSTAERSVATEHVQQAEETLARARVVLAERRAPPVPVDTFPPELRARRDSLASLSAGLGRLLSRAENAPLAASYRALGESPALVGESGTRALLDSLAEVERNRDAFGAIGGVDPIFVSLTARVTEIGRAIQAMASARRAELRQELERLRPAVIDAPVAVAPPEDTLHLIAAWATARAELDRLDGELAGARLIHADLDRRATRAREIASVSASPSAMLAAAMVIGLAVGFAVTLLGEIRGPRVADAREAETVAGVRTLARVQSREPLPERARRLADQQVPPIIDQSSDTYRSLYFQLADAATSLPRLLVVGDHPAVAAAVAANVAAAATLQARSALLVDVAFGDGAAASLLGVRPSPGLADVLEGRIGWAEAIVACLVGRDRTIDVMPSGDCRPGSPPAGAAENLDPEIARLGRRYDTVVLATPSTDAELAIAAARSGQIVVVCVRLGQTRVSALRRLIGDLRAAGAEVRGIVSWETDEPPLAPAIVQPVVRPPADATRDERVEA